MTGKILLATLMLISWTPGIVAAQIEIPWPPGGAVLAMGYDIHTGQLKNKCLKNYKERTLSRSTALVNTHNFEEVHSRRELREKLMVSVEGGARFGATSLSGKAEFAESVSISDIEAAVFAYRKSISQPDIVESVDLDNPYGLPNRGLPSNFRENCGTHYISSIVYGGELLLLIKTEVHDRTKRSEAAAKIKASGVTWNAGASASQTKELKEFSSKLTITGRKAGGSSDTTYTLEDAIQEYRTFPKQVESARAIDAKTGRDSNKGAADDTASRRRMVPISAFVKEYPHLGPIQSEYSAQLDSASEALFRYNDLIPEIAPVLKDPRRHDVADQGLGALDRYYVGLVSLRRAILRDLKACAAFAAGEQGTSRTGCDRLGKYPTPPLTALAEIPKRLMNSCDVTSVQIKDFQVMRSQFHYQRGDGRIGPGSAVFDLNLYTLPLIDGRRVRLNGEITMRETTGSRDQREFDMWTAQIDKELEWSEPGCAIDRSTWPEQRRSARKDVRFNTLGGQEFSIPDGDLVDSVTCDIRPRPSGRGMQARRMDVPQCVVRFRRHHGVRLVSEELLQADNRPRDRRDFAYPSWITPPP
jgi:hypothetical protein